jgi:hypothetical protein
MKGNGVGLWKYSEVGWPEGQTPAEMIKKAEAFFKGAQEGLEEGKRHTFEEFRDEGLVCFLNTHFFHPNGFALAFVYECEEEECNDSDASPEGRNREAR